MLLEPTRPTPSIRLVIGRSSVRIRPRAPKAPGQRPGVFALLASLATTWQPHALGRGCQGSGVIYKRGKSWRVIVYVGRDPMTGKQLRKSGSAPTRAEAKLLEARLVTEAAAGQYR